MAKYITSDLDNDLTVSNLFVAFLSGHTRQDVFPMYLLSLGHDCAASRKQESPDSVKLRKIEERDRTRETPCRFDQTRSRLLAFDKGAEDPLDWLRSSIYV